MPIDPTIRHTHRIQELEKQLKFMDEGSIEYTQTCQEIKFIRHELKVIERMKRQGVKW